MKYLKTFLMLLLLFIVSCERVNWQWNNQTVTVFSEFIRPNSVSVIQSLHKEWLVVFTTEELSNHTGIILLTRAKNIYGPWSKPDTIARTAQPCSHPAIKQFKNGKIWIQSEIGQFMDNQIWKSTGCIYIESYNYGRIFSVPRFIHARDIESWKPFSVVIEKEDGTLMLPILTGTSGNENRPGFIFSTDDGTTWSDWISMFPFKEALTVEQGSMIRLKDGRLLSIMQIAQDDQLYQTISEDGKSWSLPKATNIYGTSPHLMQNKAGSILCWYQDLWPDGVSMMNSYDFGTTFENEIQLNSGENTSSSLVDFESNQFLYFYSRQNGLYYKKLFINLVKSPDGLSASISNNFVLLRWNAIERAKYYRIYRSLASDSLLSDREVIGIVTEPVFIDSLILPGNTYSYQVTTMHGYGKLFKESGSESILSSRCDIIVQTNLQN